MRINKTMKQIHMKKMEEDGQEDNASENDDENSNDTDRSYYDADVMNLRIYMPVRSSICRIVTKTVTIQMITRKMRIMKTMKQIHMKN